MGKSFAAEHYLKWDDRIVVGKFVEPLSLTIMEKVQYCRGVLVVAPVTNSPKIIKDKVKSGIEGFGIACDRIEIQFFDSILDPTFRSFYLLTESLTKYMRKFEYFGKPVTRKKPENQ